LGWISFFINFLDSPDLPLKQLILYQTDAKS
jgi:hypothetical protein